MAQREGNDRQSIRLKGYDYHAAGAYFITICSFRRKMIFGEVANGRFQPSDIGNIAGREWEGLPSRFEYVKLGAWTLMPNHLHGIILLEDYQGGSRTAPTNTRKPLGSIVGLYKTVSAKAINQMRGSPGAPVWQRNYFEHVIRAQKAFDRIGKYIFENPLRWETDEYSTKRFSRQ